jgi:hypothetical protein
MSFFASGCLAMDSVAFDVARPIPIPAPAPVSTAIAAPNAIPIIKNPPVEKYAEPLYADRL